MEIKQTKNGINVIIRDDCGNVYKKYRYTNEEVERMKKCILVHVKNEDVTDTNGNLSAWRLDLVLRGSYLCCRCSQKEYAKKVRKHILFESLTKNNMPNWK